MKRIEGNCWSFLPDLPQGCIFRKPSLRQNIPNKNELLFKDNRRGLHYDVYDKCLSSSLCSWKGSQGKSVITLRSAKHQIQCWQKSSYWTHVKCWKKYLHFKSKVISYQSVGQYLFFQRKDTWSYSPYGESGWSDSVNNKDSCSF